MALAEMNVDRATTDAAERARGNWDANFKALAKTQDELSQRLVWPEALEWVFARDESLTARDGVGRWLSSCSVPNRAAREILKGMQLHAAVACFVCPSHAAQIQVALEGSRKTQSIIAVVESLEDLSVILSCHDF